MDAIIARIKGEPVLTYGLVGAIVSTAISFGLNLTADQVVQINLLTLAVLSFVVRTKVTPA